MTGPLEINLSSSTLEVLMKYIRDGLEATVGTWLLPWQARQEAEALRALTEGQSDALSTLLAESFDYDLSVELNSEIRGQSLSARGQKRANNFRKVVAATAQELEGIDVEYHDPDPDFNARFFGDAQDVSSEQLQLLWAKILAGEVKRPGQTSLRTLSVLRDMSPQDATVFQDIAHRIIDNRFIFLRQGEFEHRRPADLLPMFVPPFMLVRQARGQGRPARGSQGPAAGSPESCAV